MNQRQLKKHSGSAQSQTAAVYLTPTRYYYYCDFTHPCAAIGSKRLPQKEQKAAVFEISELPAKTNWKHPFAESAN